MYRLIAVVIMNKIALSDKVIKINLFKNGTTVHVRAFSQIPCRFSCWGEICYQSYFALILLMPVSKTFYTGKGNLFFRCDNLHFCFIIPSNVVSLSLIVVLLTTIFFECIKIWNNSYKSPKTLTVYNCVSRATDAMYCQTRGIIIIILYIFLNL